MMYLMMYLTMYLMMYLMMYHDSIEVFLKKKIMNSNFSAHEAIKLAPWRPGVPTSTASQLSIAWRQFSWLWRQAAFLGSTDVAQKQTDISEDVSRSCARLTLYDQPSHQNMAISIQSYVNHMIRGDISLLSLLHWISIQNMSEIIQSPSVSSPGSSCRIPAAGRFQPVPARNINNGDGIKVNGLLLVYNQVKINIRPGISPAFPKIWTLMFLYDGNEHIPCIIMRYTMIYCILSIIR